MHKQVNVTLPKVRERRTRNRVDDEAVKHVVGEPDRTQIRRLLKEGAQERAVRDLALAREWFSVGSLEPNHDRRGDDIEG